MQDISFYTTITRHEWALFKTKGIAFHLVLNVFILVSNQLLSCLKMVVYTEISCIVDYNKLLYFTHQSTTE